MEEQGACALFALRVLAAVLADGAPSALFAPNAQAAVRADAAPATLFALRALEAVWADVAPAALLAIRAHAPCSSTKRLLSSTNYTRLRRLGCLLSKTVSSTSRHVRLRRTRRVQLIAVPDSEEAE